MFAPQYNIEINNDGTNGQIGPAALKVVYDLGKKAAADFMQQQARDGGRLLLQAQVHTHILWVLVLIRTRLRLAHMDTPSPLTLLVTRKTPSKTSHLTIL